jgi:hypothetical protein
VRIDPVPATSSHHPQRALHPVSLTAVLYCLMHPVDRNTGVISGVVAAELAIASGRGRRTIRSVISRAHGEGALKSLSCR